MKKIDNQQDKNFIIKGSMKKLAIVTTHPIQYYAPWFKLLANSEIVALKVFYTWEQSKQGTKYDPGFGKKLEWDIPLLEGYDFTFVKNTSEDPGSHHFNGIINPGLIDELTELQPDAILVIGWNFKSHLKCIRYFHKKIPVLFRGDSTLLNERKGIKKILRRIFLQWVYYHIDYALYVGGNNKKYFLAHGVKKNQLVFTPHAIDNNRFAEPDAVYNTRAIEWRRELGIKEDDIVLLFAAKLTPLKNPFILLDIAQKIKSEKLKIVIVGNGKLEDNLKSAAAGDDRVIFISFQNQQQMPIVYRLGDIFILPSKNVLSRGETWGLAVNEAMASGLPVLISSNVGCGDDLVKNNINGLIFNDMSPDVLIIFINKLLNEPSRLKAMGEQSKNIIKDFSFVHIVKAIENLMAAKF